MTGAPPCLRRTICRGLLTLALVLVASAALSGTAFADQTDDDFDCTDFDSRQDAQRFYEATGGPLYDPYNLDDDGDGVACEAWDRDYERSSRRGSESNGADGVNRDCADFENQAAAQRYFLADGGSSRKNVDHLDPNHNGFACEAGEPG
jgi:hypothetical protein